MSGVPVVASKGFSEAIGNTPLIKLTTLSKQLGRNIWAKSEFQNPGGSVKDRAALYLVEDAEQKGQIDPKKPNPTIVEGSAGNTAIGLAHIARSRGYDAIFYMPDTQSQSKINLLRYLGAQVYPVPVVPITDPLNFNNRARDHAASLPNAVWTNQFENPANWKAHYASTGPEIINQLRSHGLSCDAFTCSTGTGGTFTGIAKYLKEQAPACQAVLADPPGSVIYSYVKTGKLEREGSSFTEGIGQGRITGNLQPSIDIADDAVFIPDEESIVMLYRLLDEEGLFVGGTSALNVVAAAKIAKILPTGANVVTILCDSGHKYADRIFSKDWLQSKDLYKVIPQQLLKYVSLP